MLLHLLQHAIGQDPFRRAVTAVVFALDLDDHLLHLLGLAGPLLLAHLLLLLEQLVVGLAVAAADAIPQGGELAVVVVEVKVVHGVAGGAVDDGRVGDVLAVVDHDGPDLDEGEEGDVGELLQREDEGEEVVGHALRVAVERVEGVRGVRGGHDPFVVGLVDAFVQDWVVQRAVDPVDAEVGEHDEDGELDDVVPATHPFEERMGEAGLGDGVVDEAVATDFGDEEGDGEDGHDWDGLHSLSDLHAHLVL
nr:hypothetical protein CFP56_34742 [Quercus suber]